MLRLSSFSTSSQSNSVGQSSRPSFLPNLPLLLSSCAISGHLCRGIASTTTHSTQIQDQMLYSILRVTTQLYKPYSNKKLFNKLYCTSNNNNSNEEIVQQQEEEEKKDKKRAEKKKKTDIFQLLKEPEITIHPEQAFMWKVNRIYIYILIYSYSHHPF